MKKLALLIVGMVAAASFAAPAFAEDGQAKEHGQRFKNADTNSDGKLSLDEFKVGFPKGDPEKRFTFIDADKDGFITREEMKAAHDKKAGSKPADAPAN